MPLSRGRTVVSWILQIVAAAILFQTLFFKFTGAEESVYIFTTLGIEPWGRIGSGFAELIACILLLVPRTVTIGATLSLGVISGAIFSHLTKLGIVVKDDGGLLFGLAVVVFVASGLVLLIRRSQIPIIGRWFGPPSGRGGAGGVSSKPAIGQCSVPGGARQAADRGASTNSSWAGGSGPAGSAPDSGRPSGGASESGRSAGGRAVGGGRTGDGSAGAWQAGAGSGGGGLARGGSSAGAGVGLGAATAAGAGAMKRVLILGGGFGGVYAALELEKRLARGQDVHVTLVNRENFFLFTPMLHEVAASDLDLTNIVSPVRKLLRNVDFFEGEVVGIDLPGKTVTLSHGSDTHSHEVPYDYLVLSLGSVTNFFNLPGLAERALTMKSLGDAIHLRNRLISHLEEADTECAAHLREPLLTFVVAGGGFAGVETIAGLNDFVREALPFYTHLREEMIRVVLVHPGDVILPELGEELGAYAQKQLAARKIEIRTGSKVSGISDEGVTLSDGTFIKTLTLIWTAGTSPHPTLGMLPCTKDRGRLVVNEHLEIEGFPGVWALGDCAVVPDRRTGKPHPPTAQHALREGKVVARNIAAAIRGGKKMSFDFAALGQLAAIGRRTGVAKILGFKFSGFTAWFLWRTIYLSKLPRFEKKVRVALDWTLDLFFSKDLVQFLTERAVTMSQEERPVPHAVPALAGTSANAVKWAKVEAEAEENRS